MRGRVSAKALDSNGHLGRPHPKGGIASMHYVPSRLLPAQVRLNLQDLRDSLFFRPCGKQNRYLLF